MPKIKAYKRGKKFNWGDKDAYLDGISNGDISFVKDEKKAFNFKEEDVKSIQKLLKRWGYTMRKIEGKKDE